MKEKFIKTYYCEYCGKHFHRKTDHEKYCTANSNRECRMCERKDINNIIPKYKIEIKKEWFTERSGGIIGTTMTEIEKMVAGKIKELEDEVESCPACMLTVIRCNKYRWPIEAKFDYKKYCEEWWSRKYEEEMRQAETDAIIKPAEVVANRGLPVQPPFQDFGGCFMCVRERVLISVFLCYFYD